MNTTLSRKNRTGHRRQHRHRSCHGAGAGGTGREGVHHRTSSGELDAAVAEIASTAVGIRADVSKLADLDRVYARIAKEEGRLDILFANAGGGDMLPLGAITEEQFDRIFGTNVRRCCLRYRRRCRCSPPDRRLF